MQLLISASLFNTEQPIVAKDDFDWVVDLRALPQSDGLPPTLIAWIEAVSDFDLTFTLTELDTTGIDPEVCFRYFHC